MLGLGWGYVRFVVGVMLGLWLGVIDWVGFVVSFACFCGWTSLMCEHFEIVYGHTHAYHGDGCSYIIYVSLPNS